MAKVFKIFLNLSIFLMGVFCINHDLSVYTQRNFVLKHHALTSSMVESYEDCYDKCASNMDCYSMNFYGENKCELNTKSHLSNPIDLVYDADGTYSEYDGRFVETCDDRYCSTNTICVMTKNSKVFECKECTTAFGMESNTIPNSAMTASSMWDSGHEPWRARLNNYPAMPYNAYTDAACWSSRYNTVGQYLQVDLGHVVYVTMVATQGRPYTFNQYVRKYTLAYKDGNSVFVDYKIANTVKIFQGNTDMNTIVTNRLPEKIKSQYIRFIAREWHDHISMRAEIYGCQVPR